MFEKTNKNKQLLIQDQLLAAVTAGTFIKTKGRAWLRIVPRARQPSSGGET